MVQEPSYEALQKSLREIEEELKQCRAKRNFYRQSSRTLTRIFQWISIPIIVIDKNQMGEGKRKIKIHMNSFTQDGVCYYK